MLRKPGNENAAIRYFSRNRKGADRSAPQGDRCTTNRPDALLDINGDTAFPPGDQTCEPLNVRALGSPEDIVLTKLSWFRAGGGVSDRQWKDVLGVLKVQKAALDETYLHHWPTKLHVNDLLEKALKESRERGR